MTVAPHRLGVVEAATAIREGRLSAEALVRSCLERIADREPLVRAWAHLDPEAAIAAARRADAAGAGGPLHGVPIAVKDLIDTHDLPTEYGTPIYRGHRPAWDASCVALARRAGAIVLGKTVTTEFAYFSPGPTANPHDLSRTPGGSSSGSAAAVADRMVPIGFGTQTAASVTRPASFCGLVGYKAGHGQFSLAGIRAFAVSFDSLGLLARSVADAQWLRGALLGVGMPAAAPSLARPPRIGVCRTPSWEAADADARAALATAAQRLADAGADVTEAPAPVGFETLVEVHRTIMACEAAASLAFEHDAHAARLSQPLRQLLDEGRALPRERFLAALEAAQLARAAFERWARGWDALLAPGAPGAAPVGLQATGDPVFSRMWTLLQGPSVVLPGLRAASGLPVGVQLVGRMGSDDALLALARWAEPVIAGRPG